jgi:DNA-binding NtrC family response regulator
MATRLLYVDDEADLRDLVENQLLLEGFEVTTASDGVNALEILTQHSFDVVLLDVRMPRMNGIEVLQAMRDRNLHPRTIMLTGDSDISVLARCAQYGVRDFLTKPYNFHELVDSIGRVMACVLTTRENSAGIAEPSATSCSSPSPLPGTCSVAF